MSSLNASNKSLHIGINYLGTANELSGCINDVDTIQKHVSVSANRRLILTDKTATKPTKTNVLQAIKWLLCRACTNTQLFSCPHVSPHISSTVLYFTYSGHGSQISDTNSDEKDGLDETFYLLDGNLSDDILNAELVQKVPKNVRLWVESDCCHSASSLDLRYGLERSGPNTFTLTVNNDKAVSKGEVIVISGCRDTGTSADACINNKAQGALTAAIDSILVKNKNATLTDFYDQLINFMKEGGYEQRPVLSFGNNLVLSLSFFQAN